MEQHSIEEIRRFRDALGKFTTGVTVITTRSRDGMPVGLTANSFSSVSLTPPLVLWSLARNATVMEAFSFSSYFNIHVLSDRQQNLSDQFASPVENRFSGVELEPSANDIPLFGECVARFQCRKVAEHDGGDHVIYIGEVVEFDHCSAEPLVYSAGEYSRIAPL